MSNAMQCHSFPLPTDVLTRAVFTLLVCFTQLTDFLLHLLVLKLSLSSYLGEPSEEKVVVQVMGVVQAMSGFIIRLVRMLQNVPFI